MNCKRFMLAAVVVFVFVFLYEWVFHGMLMADMYAQTANLWRSEADMEAKFMYLVAGQLLFAVMITWVFIRGYENRGIGEGLRFGIIMTLLLNAPMLVMYAVAPYPEMMVFGWVAGSLVECLVIGVLLALLYKPKTMAA